MFGVNDYYLIDMFNIVRPIYTTRRIGPGVRSYPSRMIGYPANINRHTGEPHEHKREIARRIRQGNKAF